MRARIMRTLDVFIPADIKEFEQNEEMVRARSIVFFNLVNLVASLGLILALAMGMHTSDELRQIMPYTLMTGCVGNVLALWIFYHSGLFAVASNIYVLSLYLSNTVTILALNNPQYVILLLPLLALPVVMSLIANHLSALVWLAIVTFTPSTLAVFSDFELDQFFSGSYFTTCFGLFLALYMGNYYRESMRERLNSERTQFEFAAAHDSLTGIPNRATFDRRLQECIDYCTLHDTKAVLIYIDLDKFKPINDTYGHQAGDIVLKTVSKRLRQLVRTADTVARLGGDEFAILFEQCDPLKIDAIIKRVAVVVSEPIQVFDNTLSVGCSIGKVVCPDDGLHPEQLAHKADERMYRQKRRDEPVSNVAPINGPR